MRKDVNKKIESEKLAEKVKREKERKFLWEFSQNRHKGERERREKLWEEILLTFN